MPIPLEPVVLCSVPHQPQARPQRKYSALGAALPAQHPIRHLYAWSLSGGAREVQGRRSLSRGEAGSRRLGRFDCVVDVGLGVRQLKDITDGDAGAACGMSGRPLWLAPSPARPSLGQGVQTAGSASRRAAAARYRGRAAGRPVALDRERYKERNTVERCFGKLSYAPRPVARPRWRRALRPCSGWAGRVWSRIAPGDG
jgi:hypothetical protein